MIGVELAVEVDLAHGDVAGKVFGKRQHEVSAGTRKRRHRSPTSWVPHKIAITNPVQPHTPGMGCVMSSLGIVVMGSCVMGPFLPITRPARL